MKLMMKQRIIAIALLAAAQWLSGMAHADEVVQGQKEVIISGHSEATRLGMEVLQKGGTAADAFVTVSLSLGVAEPGNSGLGGKMVALYYDAKSRSVSCVVAMDAAPLRGDIQKMVTAEGARQQRGWVNVCTPGLAAGLGEFHRRWGTRPWADLVAPAADLAEKGVTLSPLAADMLAEFPVGVDAVAGHVYAPAGHTLRAGEVMRNPDLAYVLRIIARDGAAAFYSGEIASRLVAGARAGGGFLSLEDLKNYRARVLTPVSAEYKGYRVFSSPPPLSGGTTLLTALKCLEKERWQGAQPRNVAYIDAISRVFQQVYPEVARSAADVPDSFMNVQRVLSVRNIAGMVERALTADPRNPYAKLQKAAMLSPALTDDEPEYASTTHLIIVDRFGNVVCCTQSLGLHFGAAVMAPGTGVLLNADINNFSLKSQTSLNYIAPGKWPRSTMSPTLFLKDGAPVLAIGSPAGQRIPTAVLQVALDVLDFHRPLADAVRAARFHIRSGISRPDGANKIDLESQSPAFLDAALKARGWDVNRRDVRDFYFGSVNAALIRPEGITAVADLRRTADADGQ